MRENLNGLISTDFTELKQFEEYINSRENCFVGWVDSFNNDLGTINVQPAIQNKLITQDNSIQYQNKPFLINCWVVANTLNRNPQKGDKCLVMVLDEKSNNFFKAQYDSSLPLQQQTNVNTSKSRKSTSNCVAVIINPNFVNGGSSSVKWGDIGGDIKNQTDLYKWLTDLQKDISDIQGDYVTINTKQTIEGEKIFTKKITTPNLYLNTEIPWEFTQDGTGANSSLLLRSTADGKEFKITTPSKEKGVKIGVSEGANNWLAPMTDGEVSLGQPALCWKNFYTKQAVINNKSGLVTDTPDNSFKNEVLFQDKNNQNIGAVYTEVGKSWNALNLNLKGKDNVVNNIEFVDYGGGVVRFEPTTTKQIDLGNNSNRRWGNIYSKGNLDVKGQYCFSGYDGPCGTILNKGSIIKTGSVVNNKVYTADETLANNLSLTGYPTLRTGSIIKANSIVNGELYTTDTTINANTILYGTTTLKSGSKITSGSNVNATYYSADTTLSADLSVTNFAVSLLKKGTLLKSDSYLNSAKLSADTTLTADTYAYSEACYFEIARVTTPGTYRGAFFDFIISDCDATQWARFRVTTYMGSNTSKPTVNIDNICANTNIYSGAILVVANYIKNASNVNSNNVVYQIYFKSSYSYGGLNVTIIDENGNYRSRTNKNFWVKYNNTTVPLGVRSIPLLKASDIQSGFTGTVYQVIRYANNATYQYGTHNFLNGLNIVGALNMNNNTISKANHITISDPGPNEGIEWLGGNGWKIYESPDNLSSQTGGNLQFVTGSTRRCSMVYNTGYSSFEINHPSGASRIVLQHNSISSFDISSTSVNSFYIWDYARKFSPISLGNGQTSIKSRSSSSATTMETVFGTDGYITAPVSPPNDANDKKLATTEWVKSLATSYQKVYDWVYVNNRLTTSSGSVTMDLSSVLPSTSNDEVYELLISGWLKNTSGSVGSLSKISIKSDIYTDNVTLIEALSQVRNVSYQFTGHMTILAHRYLYSYGETLDNMVIDLLAYRRVK